MFLKIKKGAYIFLRCWNVIPTFFYTEIICKESLRETPGMLSKREQNSCSQIFYNTPFQQKFILEIYRTTFVVVIYWF